MRKKPSNAHRFWPCCSSSFSVSQRFSWSAEKNELRCNLIFAPQKMAEGWRKYICMFRFLHRKGPFWKPTTRKWLLTLGENFYFKGIHFYSTTSFLYTPFSFTCVNTMLIDTSLSSLLSWVSKHLLNHNRRCHLSLSPQFPDVEVECRHAVPHSVLIKKLPLTNEQFDSHTCCLSADLRGDLSLTACVIWERSSPCRSNKPPLLLTQVSFSHFSSSVVPSVLLFSSTVSFC